VVVARFARLYPAHVFVLAALGLAFLVEAAPAALTGTPISTALREVIPEQHDGRLWTFGLNLLLLHNVGLTPNGLTWNAPSWSISVEFFGSLAILGLVAAWRRPGIRIVLSTIALVGYTFVFGLNDQQLDATFETIGHVVNLGLVRCLAGIALGVLCLLYVRRHLTREALGTTAATALELFALAAVAAITIRPEYHSPWDAAFPLASAALVVVFSLEAGLVTRMLQLPPMQYLGSLSYSIYLVHWPLLFVMQEQYHLSALLYYPAVLAAAVLTHHLVEVPARRALMRCSVALRATGAH
jgi:peptidoglycan/LPS O-acetylase OafA/YrhL